VNQSLSPRELQTRIGNPVQIVEVAKSSIYAGHPEMMQKRWKLKSFEAIGSADIHFVSAYLEDDFKDTVYINGVKLKDWP
jgi:hypothetical protein